MPTNEEIIRKCIELIRTDDRVKRMVISTAVVFAVFVIDLIIYEVRHKNPKRNNAVCPAKAKTGALCYMVEKII